tara:strand:- start:724 stop:915 length:192 start_codon:yes stop_codon:yes gene_type:complete
MNNIEYTAQVTKLCRDWNVGEDFSHLWTLRILEEVTKKCNRLTQRVGELAEKIEDLEEKTSDL